MSSLQLGAYREGYEAGKAEGRRLERRAVLRIVKRLVPMLTIYPLKAKLLARRTKPAKRKEGWR